MLKLVLLLICVSLMIIMLCLVEKKKKVTYFCTIPSLLCTVDLIDVANI